MLPKTHKTFPHRNCFCINGKKTLIKFVFKYNNVYLCTRRNTWILTPKVYNAHLRGDIIVKGISIDEAKHHSCKSYKSTIAVIKHLEAVLENAFPIQRTPIKPGNKNQSRFDSLLVMKHEVEGLGTVKLTVGIRKPKGERSDIFTEYGISVIRPDQDILNKDTKYSKKKKAHQ